MSAYGRLCTEFYDLTKPLASGAELEFYKEHLNKNDLILEPMCGTGRLLIPLLQAGFTIHGLDNSKDMLENCKNRILNLNLPKPILFEMSVEKMELPHKYDAIIIPFGSFQLFHPRTQAYSALKTFKKHLRPQGKLILDLFIPWEALYPKGEEESSSKEISAGDNVIIKLETHNIVNKYEQYYTGNNTYYKIKSGKIIATEKEQLTIAWYYRYEIELILEKFGFNSISYQKRKLNQEEAVTFIAEA